MPGFARSISQRFTRRRRRNQQHEPEEIASPVQDAMALASSTTIVPINKPGLLTRGMDRIRRSLRIPARRRDGGGGNELARAIAGGATGANGGTQGASTAGADWHPDESAVRAGLCSFVVKYLGSVEVFESRGMQVCEGALKLLRAQNKTPTKAVLYVSGDGIRLVDQSNNRGLIVDQTIEKVSFCAPDKSNSKGFAYICREGSSRRWMCHGFLAVHESGERLSHAVGCAFAVCLERKKKRDNETTITVEKALNPNWGENNGSDSGSSFPRTNPAYSSFRRSMPIAERVLDPQGAIVPGPAVPPNASPNLGGPSRVPPPSIAKPRPSANPALFERQGSLRAPSADSATVQQFKRQFSLRTYENKPYQCPSSLMHEAIPEESTDGLLIPELAGLVPQTSPVPQAAPTYPVHSPPPTVAWTQPAPAPMLPPQTLGPLPSSVHSSPARNAFAGSQSGFTPQQDIVVTTQWTEGGSSSMSPPSSSRSRADEWLEHTLIRSLTLNSPPSPSIGTPLSPQSARTFMQAAASSATAPPAHPPPPLPPAALLASPDRPVGDKLFERHEENINPQWSPSPVMNGSSSLSSASPRPATVSPAKVVFPTVFSPETPFPPPIAVAPTTVVQTQPCADPFDVQWSRLALSNTNSR